MKRITTENASAIRPGSRVWVKEWDETYHVVGFTPGGLLVVMGLLGRVTLDPARVSIYLLDPEEPATVSPGVFYHVAEVNWI